MENDDPITANKSGKMIRFICCAVLLVFFSNAALVDSGSIKFWHTANISVFNARIPNNRKIAVLTLDDGPFEKSTPEIIKILNEHGVKATFFLVGSMVQKNPHLLDLIKDNGHEIANHTYTHPNLSKKSNAEIKRELALTKNIFSQHGISAQWFRPPYLAVNKEIVEIARELGLKTISWSVSSCDFRGYSPQKIIETIEKQLHNGAIILLHEHGFRSNTVQALPGIIKMLKSHGYEMVTLSEWYRLVSDPSDPSKQPIASR